MKHCVLFRGCRFERGPEEGHIYTGVSRVLDKRVEIAMRPTCPVCVDDFATNLNAPTAPVVIQCGELLVAHRHGRFRDFHVQVTLCADGVRTTLSPRTCPAR